MISKLLEVLLLLISAALFFSIHIIVARDWLNDDITVKRGRHALAKRVKLRDGFFKWLLVWEFRKDIRRSHYFAYVFCLVLMVVLIGMMIVNVIMEEVPLAFSIVFAGLFIIFSVMGFFQSSVSTTRSNMSRPRKEWVAEVRRDIQRKEARRVKHKQVKNRNRK